MAGEQRIDRSEIDAVERLEKTVKRLILLIGGALTAVFGVMEMKDLPFDRVSQSFDQFSLIKVALFLFVAGWIMGAGDDTEIQRQIMLRDRRKAKFNVLETLGIVVFFAAFALLLSLTERPVWFQLALLVFLAVNILAYDRLILPRVEEESRTSEAKWLDEKDRDYLSYMKLYCALGYLRGSWQKKRFITLIALALIQVAVAIVTHTDAYRPYVPNTVIWKLGLHTWIEYLPSILFLTYVLVSEIWMKIYRIKIRADFVTIERMRDHFSLQRKRNLDLPPLERSSLFGDKHDDNRNYVGSIIGLLKWD